MTALRAFRPKKQCFMVFKTCGGYAVPHRGVDGNGHACLIEKEYHNGSFEPEAFKSQGLSFYGLML